MQYMAMATPKTSIQQQMGLANKLQAFFLVTDANSNVITKQNAMEHSEAKYSCSSIWILRNCLDTTITVNMLILSKHIIIIHTPVRLTIIK